MSVAWPEVAVRCEFGTRRAAPRTWHTVSLDDGRMPGRKPLATFLGLGNLPAVLATSSDRYVRDLRRLCPSVAVESIPRRTPIEQSGGGAESANVGECGSLRVRCINYRRSESETPLQMNTWNSLAERYWGSTSTLDNRNLQLLTDGCGLGRSRLSCRSVQRPRNCWQRICPHDEAEWIKGDLGEPMPIKTNDCKSLQICFGKTRINDANEGIFCSYLQLLEG